ncbi:MAG: hypothetical protein RMY28_000795 [Nostoc sp. ChiSLP01]|nr:hypothetical protein [Nostoc sp. CmiSLP01]MDZ8289143.1 hypothetical protein [Nostoc sp. ChiSLP01]
MIIPSSLASFSTRRFALAEASRREGVLGGSLRQAAARLRLINIKFFHLGVLAFKSWFFHNNEQQVET